MFLDYFALFIVIFVVIFIFYATIAIHDIPYEISVHRNHPYQDAIHVAADKVIACPNIFKRAAYQRLMRVMADFLFGWQGFDRV